MSPAGPLAIPDCPSCITFKGVNPNSACGIPNCCNFDSYVISKSSCALHTRANSYCKSFIIVLRFWRRSWRRDFYETRYINTYRLIIINTCSFVFNICGLSFVVASNSASNASLTSSISTNDCTFF